VEVATNGSYQEIEKDGVYRVVTNSFLAGGGDGYTMFLESSNKIDLGSTDYEVLADYIIKHSPIEPRVEGRIIIAGD